MKKFFYTTIRKGTLTCLFFSWSIALAMSQGTSGYYQSAVGKKKAELKTALHQIISQLTPLSYGSGEGATWSGFEKTDNLPGGIVRDMYSNEIRYFQGNGSSVTGMNIEHSLPKSWWGSTQNNAYKDVQQLRPSDATANSRKSNYIMAPLTSTSWTNGVTKVGKTNVTGASVNAWEPDDRYKGDFARIYMYMVTCYENFGSEGLWTGTESAYQVKNETYPVFTDWTIDMLLKWSREDPIDSMEHVRNEAAFEIQGNRNPFIDFSSLPDYIWGDSTEYAFEPTFVQTVTDPVEFSHPSGAYSNEILKVGLFSKTEGAKIYYTLDSSEPTTSSTLYTDSIALTAYTVVKACAYSDDFYASPTRKATYYVGQNSNICNSIAELREKNTGSTSLILLLNDVDVNYSGYNYYLQDNSGAILLYGVNSSTCPSLLTAKTGQRMSCSIQGTFTSYYGMKEFKPTEASVFDVYTPEETRVPEILTIDKIIANYADYEHKLVRIRGVRFASNTMSSNKLVFTQGTKSMTLYNSVKLSTISSFSYPTDKDMDVTGMVSSYTSGGTTTYQLDPRSTSDIIVYGPGVGIEEIQSDVSIVDKTFDSFTIATCNTPVFSIAGNLITTLKSGQCLNELHLPQGIYLVKGNKLCF